MCILCSSPIGCKGRRSPLLPLSDSHWNNSGLPSLGWRFTAVTPVTLAVLYSDVSFTMSGRVLVGVKRVIDYAVKVTSHFCVNRHVYFWINVCSFCPYLTFPALLAPVSLTASGSVHWLNKAQHLRFTSLTGNLRVITILSLNRIYLGGYSLQRWKVCYVTQVS